MFSTSKFLEFDGTNDFHATQCPHVGIFWMTKHEQNSFLGFLGISWDFLGIFIFQLLVALRFDPYPSTVCI